MHEKIFLTGEPKSGKTTIIKNLTTGISQKQGFLTEEVRNAERRIGFDIITAGELRIPLARESFRTSQNVGRFVVNTSEFDEVVPQLMVFAPSDTLYIDEISKMQLFSDAFKHLVTVYLNASNLLIATIASIHDDAFIETVKKRDDVQLITVTAETREHIYDDLKQLLVKN